jgi:uncharacterized membrane protein YfcA
MVLKFILKLLILLKDLTLLFLDFCWEIIIGILLLCIFILILNFSSDYFSSLKTENFLEIFFLLFCVAVIIIIFYKVFSQKRNSTLKKDNHIDVTPCTEIKNSSSNNETMRLKLLNKISVSFVSILEETWLLLLFIVALFITIPLSIFFSNHLPSPFGEVIAGSILLLILVLPVCVYVIFSSKKGKNRKSNPKKN